MYYFIKSLALVLLCTWLHFYFYNSDYVKKVDYKVYDAASILMNKMKEEEKSAYSVVVDIDEKSIEAFGQWPWSRVIDAELINKLSKLNPSAIGVSILFPEEDRLSPLSIQTFYQRHFAVKIDLNLLPTALHDNDQLLSQALYHSNSTLSIYLQNKFDSKAHCEEMQYKGNIFSQQRVRLYGEELLCNHAVIQDKIENFGFLNAWRDDDGIFRRVPLFMNYKEEVFPSFALATLLSFDDEVKVNKEEDSVLVDFSKRTLKVLSASDILTDKVSVSDVQGKVVIVGSSVIGTNSNYRISTNEELSKPMIHAYIVDNILNNTLLVQPEVYKIFNMFLSLFLSLIMTLLLSQKDYLRASLLLFIFGMLSFISLVLMYMQCIYISLGYLWTPFLSFFIFLILYHINIINREQQAQEKLFIRQSKLASMGEMISLIAHQWRQPLSTINGTVLNMDMDYRKKKLDEKRFNKYLDDIEMTTGYLSQTINDFTDFFSKNKEPHLFKLSSVITQAKDLSLNTLLCNVEIIYENSGNIEIKGYASELVQSLLVLLNNAMHVCHQNLHKVEQGKIFIHVSKVGKSVLIAIEDNGGGIERKDMKKIFDPYFTTKEKHNGTGLGLYILKLIVEDSMNGKISVMNTQEGAVFTIKIPTNME